MILGDIQLPAQDPFCEGRFPLEDAFPALPPDQLACLARPEFFRAIDRLAIHPPILLEAAHPSGFRESPGRFENPFLDEMGLDVLRHGKEASAPPAALNGKLRAALRS